MGASGVSIDHHVMFCRVAAVVFAAVSLYTVVIKLPSGEFGNDWAHTAFHVVTAVVAFFLGWIKPNQAAARAFTWGVAVLYGILGIVGWFMEGIAMGEAYRIPLSTADNIFHVALSLAGFGFIFQAHRRRTFSSADREIQTL